MTTIRGLLISVLLLTGSVGLAQQGVPTVPPPTTIASFQPQSAKLICSSLAGTCSCTGFTDASVQNQWNVITCQLPAATLRNAGDWIAINVNAKAAANTNAKEFQLYWNGATCSGNSAGMCSSGTQLSSTGSSTSGVNLNDRAQVLKTGASTQNANDLTILATSIGNNVVTTSTATDTGTVQIAWGVRNTAAAAASIQGTPTLTIMAYHTP